MNSSCIVSLTADPITVGHRDIIKRASSFFEKIYILIPEKSSKSGHLLSYEERKRCIEYDVCKDGVENFKVLPIHTGKTLVNEAVELGCNVIVRGLRNEQDLIYETDMAAVNRMLQPSIETVYLPCKPELSFVSSSMVRELLKLGSYEVAEKFTSARTMMVMKRACTKVVALTGGIACGKSTAREVFKERGWAILDADEINRECILKMRSTVKLIAKELAEYGEINIEDPAKDIAKIVFSNKEALDKLEALSFPVINSYINSFIEDWRMCPAKKIVVEVPLLFEDRAAKFTDFFDTSVCIFSDRDTMIHRMVENRGLSATDAAARIEMQMDPSKKAAMCDYAVENYAGLALDYFKEKVNNVIDELERKA